MIGVLDLGIIEMLVRSNDLMIGEHEVVNEIGIVSKHSTSIHYSSITDISLHQSFFQRLVGIGDLHINTAGTNQREITLSSFSNINEIHSLISQRMRKASRHSG